MMFSALAAILIYALAVPLPGPSFVAVTRATIVSGRTAEACAALGVTTAVAIYALAVLLGVSALLTTLPWLVTAIQLAGGVYLLYLGATLLRSHFRTRVALVESSPHRSAADRSSSRQAFVRGFAATIGNPKMAAFAGG